MASGGTDPQGEMVLPRYRPREGCVEGIGGDYKSPARSLHHLPRLLPWIPGRSRDRYCHPQGKNAPEVRVHEGEGPVYDLSETSQVV